MKTHPLKNHSDITGKSLFDIAKLLGISKSHVVHIISGRRQAGPKLAIKIEQKLGIPKTQLRPDIWQ